VLDVADRVTYSLDTESGFPLHYSGEVVVSMLDGRELRHREQVNRGAAGRPLTRDEVEHKYRENMSLTVSARDAEATLQAIWALPDCSDLRHFAQSLSRQDG